MFADVTERKFVQANQQRFYRRTIFAATQGKLIITERDELLELAGPPIKQWEISSVEDANVVRDETVAIAACKRVYLATGPQGTVVACEIPIVNTGDALAGLSDWGE